MEAASRSSTLSVEERAGSMKSPHRPVIVVGFLWQLLFFLVLLLLLLGVKGTYLCC